MKYFLRTAFATIYAFWKIPLSKLEHKISKNVYNLILKLLTFLSLFLITLIVLPFAFYRFLVWFYLKVKHGDDFLKMLNFLSSSYFIVEGNFATTKTMFLVESQDGDALERKVKDICKVMSESVPEYTSIAKKCSGYYYLLKRPYTLDEVFVTISFNDGTLLNEEKISRYVANCVLTNERLFQMVFFKEPFKNNKYIILLLFHHGITDAHGMYITAYKYIFDKETIPIQNNLPAPRQEININDSYVDLNTLRNMVNHNKESICKGPYFAIFMEEEISCLPKLRILRRRFNCSLNELFLAIITYNLYRLGKLPNKMLLSYVHHLRSDYKNHFQNMVFNTNDISNNTYLLIFLVENFNSCNDIEDFIEVVHKKSQEGIHSVMLEVRSFSDTCLHGLGHEQTKGAFKSCYALSKGVFDFMPEILYRNELIRQLTQPILIFSNIGIIKGKTIDKKPLVGIIGGMSSSGIYAGLMTCNDRLSLMMGSKLHIFNSQEDVQVFMESCIACVHELYEKVTYYSH